MPDAYTLPPVKNRQPASFPRWFVFIILCVALVLTGCSSEQEPDAASAKAPEVQKTYRGIIAAVGDSLTAGLGVDESRAYPAQLGARLLSDGHNFKVINAGVSGETSSGTLSRINWVMSTLKPDIVILETGANDGLRGIDPAVLRNNLDDLVTILKENNIRVILAGMQMLPNLGPEYTKIFAGIYPEIAEKHKVILIPFFLEGVAGEATLNQPDKIHPTAEGYSHIVDTIYPYVLQSIEEFLKNSDAEG